MSAPTTATHTSDDMSAPTSPANIPGHQSAPGTLAVTQHESSTTSIALRSTHDEVPAPASPNSAPLLLSSPAAPVSVPEEPHSSPPSPAASMGSLLEFALETEEVRAVVSINEEVVTEVCEDTTIAEREADHEVQPASGDEPIPPPSCSEPPSIKDDGLDELFNDTGSPPRTPLPSTVAHVALSQAPVNEDSANDNRQPQSHGVDEPARSPKRKREATPTENLINEGDFGEIKPPRQTKKMKVHEDTAPEVAEQGKAAVEKEKPTSKIVARETKSGLLSGRVEKKSSPVKNPSPGQLWKNKDHTKLVDTIVENENKRLLKNAAVNQHFKTMSKWDYIKVEKGSATVKDYEIKVNKTKVQIAGVAPMLGPNINRARALGGKKTKFDLQDTRAEIPEAKIGAWKGSKWTDEDDPNITWYNIPVKQKTISIPGRMIPLDGIVTNPAAYPEFTFEEKIMVDDPKTGRQEVGFYRISYEKLSSEEATARGKVMVKQANADAAQRKKDETASRRREKTLGSKSRVKKA
jgi:hypothetical protein